MTIPITHEYYLDGEKHLSEQARLTGAQLMARSHLPLRGKFLLKIGETAHEKDHLIGARAQAGGDVLKRCGKVEAA
jgi:hypothetical protein